MLVMLIAVAACESNDPTDDPVEGSLTISARPAAVDTIGALPLQGIVAEVRHKNGDLFTDVLVRFSALPADRYLVGVALAEPSSGFDSAAAVLTNARGRATALVRFGQRLGPTAVEISVPRLGLADTIAFTVNPGQPAQVILLPRDTTVSAGKTVSVRGTVADRYGHPLPNQIAYAAVPTPAGGVSAGGQIRAERPGRITVVGRSGTATDTISATVVPTGTIAAFNFSTRHFVLMELDGAGLRNVTLTPVEPDPEHEPTWSPDGSEIVFTSGGALAFLNVATGAVTTLPAQPAIGYQDPFWPTYTPDGRQVYFTVFTQTPGIARIDRDGSNFAIVVPGNFNSRVSFAPDGKSLVYHSLLNAYVLRLYDLESGSIRPFDRAGLYPEWSPTDQQIAYFGPEGMVRLMNADGSKDRTIASGFPTQPISWSPDGRWLLLARDQGISVIGVAPDVKGLQLPAPVPAFRVPIWRPRP